MAFPHIFATLSGTIPASFLDDNFNAALQIAGHNANSIVGNNTGGVAGVVDLTMAQVYAMLKSVIPFEWAPFLGGVPGASWFAGRYQPSTNLTLVTGSCSASAGTASTGTATFNILDNGAGIGTVVFTASATGVVSITGSPRAFTAGHVLAIQAPASPDASLADINFTLGGFRA